MPTPSDHHVFGAKPVPATAESPYKRSYFYVGGEYADAGNGDGQRIFTGQMYVEQLVPIDGVKRPYPIVFIQGAGQTGTVSSIIAFSALVAWYTARDLLPTFHKMLRQ